MTWAPTSSKTSKLDFEIPRKLWLKLKQKQKKQKEAKMFISQILKQNKLNKQMQERNTRNIETTTETPSSSQARANVDLNPVADLCWWCRVRRGIRRRCGRVRLPVPQTCWSLLLFLLVLSIFGGEILLCAAEKKVKFDKYKYLLVQFNPALTYPLLAEFRL